MDLIYTGKVRTTFLKLGKELAPDEGFFVPDEEADGYLARDDVEKAPKAKKSRVVRPLAMPDSLNELPAPETPAPQAPDDMTN